MCPAKIQLFELPTSVHRFLFLPANRHLVTYWMTHALATDLTKADVVGMWQCLAPIFVDEDDCEIIPAETFEHLLTVLATKPAFANTLEAEWHTEDLARRRLSKSFITATTRARQYAARFTTEQQERLLKLWFTTLWGVWRLRSAFAPRHFDREAFIQELVARALAAHEARAQK